jgi:hypothetical protein
MTMYVYYGTISFQVLSILYAAAFVLATLPFITSSMGVWRWVFNYSSEIAAYLVIFSGMALFLRNMELANRWFTGDLHLLSHYSSLKESIEYVEKRPSDRATGKLFARLMFGIALAYTTVSTLVMLLSR